jgi:hypothetical protein
MGRMYSKIVMVSLNFQQEVWPWRKKDHPSRIRLILTDGSEEFRLSCDNP